MKAGKSDEGSIFPRVVRANLSEQATFKLKEGQVGRQNISVRTEYVLALSMEGA